MKVPRPVRGLVTLLGGSTALLEGSKACQRAGSPSVRSQGLSEGWQPFWMVPRPIRGLADLLEGLAALLESSEACRRAASPSGWSDNPSGRFKGPSGRFQGLSEAWQTFWKVWQPFWKILRHVRGLAALLEGSKVLSGG